MVVTGRAEMGPDPGEEALRQLRLRYRLAASTADAYADEGFTAVVQDVILGPELARFVAAIRTRPLFVVVLAPRADVVAGREEARNKTGYGGFAVAQLDRGLREDTPRIGLWLDTSGQTVAETVDEILARAPAEAAVGA
jgi:hypothetical protein